MLKPPAKGALDGVPPPKPAASCITRSGTSGMQTASSNKPMSVPKATSINDQQIELIAEEEHNDNDVALSETCKDFSTTLATLQPIVEALNKILAGNSLTVETIKWIFKYIRKLEAAERENKEKMEIQAKVSSFRKAFKTDLHQVCGDLARQLYGITDMLNVTLETSEKALKVAEEIKGRTSDIINGVGKVMSIMDKIADTMQSYHNILLSRQTPANKASVDPKVLGDMERKDRQILVDIFDKEGTCTMDKSLMELMELANKVLDQMSDSKKPEKVKVKGIHKTKRNAILLMLNSKEAANWVRDVGNELTFVNAFSKGALICNREFNLVVSRVPLTFDPKKDTDLREVEESNRLPSCVICKARWIKPAECRRLGQTHAYIVLTVTSVDVANKLIRDRLGICSSHSRPTKQKKEPIQCMKCRRWGHFADKCPKSVDTCGTCGDKHRTNECKVTSKLFCVSCADSSHASWDRACPEFIRWCKIINECNPVNNMLFFPVEQDWTLVTRPSRIPLGDRFPATYAVNSLPIHSRALQAYRRKESN